MTKQPAWQTITGSIIAAAVGVVAIVLALRNPQPRPFNASPDIAASSTSDHTTRSMTAPSEPPATTGSPNSPLQATAPSAASLLPTSTATTHRTTPVDNSIHASTNVATRDAEHWLQTICAWRHQDPPNANSARSRPLMTATADIGQKWETAGDDWAKVSREHIDARCVDVRAHIDAGNPTAADDRSLVVVLQARQVFSRSGEDFQSITVTEVRIMHRTGGRWLVGASTGTA